MLLKTSKKRNKRWLMLATMTRLSKRTKRSLSLKLSSVRRGRPIPKGRRKITQKRSQQEEGRLARVQTRVSPVRRRSLARRRMNLRNLPRGRKPDDNAAEILTPYKSNSYKY
jgi:hypothetical protein